MKKKIRKIICLFLIIICCFSTSMAGYIPTDRITPGFFDPNGNPLSTPVPEKVTEILGLMMWIGYVIATCMIIIIGIKYILASADEKASLKGTLVKVVIGSMIIVFSSTIFYFVYTLLLGG